jgi:hypothetical protein
MTKKVNLFSSPTSSEEITHLAMIAMIENLSLATTIKTVPTSRHLFHHISPTKAKPSTTIPINKGSINPTPTDPFSALTPTIQHRTTMNLTRPIPLLAIKINPFINSLTSLDFPTILGGLSLKLSEKKGIHTLFKQIKTIPTGRNSSKTKLIKKTSLHYKLPSKDNQTLKRFTLSFPVPRSSNSLKRPGKTLPSQPSSRVSSPWKFSRK